MNDIGKVRLLIAEVDTANEKFTDAQIEAYLEIHNGNLFRAAASAVRAIAIDEALLRDVKTDDLQVTSSTVAKALNDIALRLEAQADDYEMRESQDVFELVFPHQLGSTKPELHTRWWVCP
jgi:hypothetical protein